jgi:hypothetical protein
MKRTLIFGLCLFISAIGVGGDSHYRYIYSWDTDVYFGHVIYPEAEHDGQDALVVREGQTKPEIANLNLPVSPGDTIKTSGRRCEIQFDTGTIIRLDRNTELKVETILARSLSSRNQLTNLLLIRGQIYLMYKQYVRKEIFQVITPNAAVKLGHQSVAMIRAKPDGQTDVLMKEGKAHVLFGMNENAIQREAVKKSGTITITGSHQLAEGPYAKDEAFEDWNREINEDFPGLHEDKAFIPLPIQKLSKAVYYFAQKYSTLNGEWLWDSYLGYVWRPFLNDSSYPWGGWRPYVYGRWTSVQGQLFWVPQETWGWVPYHLGIWMWNKNKGWIWVPGTAFAPAWVDWALGSGYCCWRPWSYLDWYGYGWGMLSYFEYFVHMDRDRDLEPFLGEPGGATVRQVISKDQLKDKKPRLPLPQKEKAVYKKVMLALEKGEEWALSLLREMPSQMAIVRPDDLNSPRIQEKIVPLDSLSQEEKKEFFTIDGQQDAFQLASQVFARNEKLGALRAKIDYLIREMGQNESLPSGSAGDPFAQEEKIIKQEGKIIKREETAASASEAPAHLPPPRGLKKQTGAISERADGISKGTVPAGSSPDRHIQARFRDWNPDVEVARTAGVTIRYSSRYNEVRCPELNLSSRHVTGSFGYAGPRVRLTARGPVSASGSEGAFTGGGAAPTNGSGSSSSSNASTSGGAKSSGSSGSGKTKK